MSDRRVCQCMQAQGTRDNGEGQRGHGVLLRLCALLDDPLANERAAHLCPFERVGVLSVEVRLGVGYNVNDEALKGW